MEAFTTLDGLVAPLDRSNVDTDAIIPKQFLKSIHKTGFGPYLFDAWRYQDIGQPGQDCSTRPLNEDFVLNRPRYRGAEILLARANFGCGSSREHAPIAIKAAGVSCVIAASFARIFYRNSFNMGLPILESPEAAADVVTGEQLEIDLSTGTIVNKSRNLTYKAQPVPVFMQELLAAGGLIPYVMKHLSSSE